MANTEEAVAMATVAMATGAQVTALAVAVAIRGTVEEAAAAVAGAAEGAVAAVVVETPWPQALQFLWDHANSKGGAALDKCKLEDGSWNVDSIMDGKRG